MPKNERTPRSVVVNAMTGGMDDQLSIGQIADRILDALSEEIEFHCRCGESRVGGYVW